MASLGVFDHTKKEEEKKKAVIDTFTDLFEKFILVVQTRRLTFV